MKKYKYRRRKKRRYSNNLIKTFKFKTFKFKKNNGIKYNKKLMKKIRNDNKKIEKLFGIKLDNGKIGTEHPRLFKHSHKEIMSSLPLETHLRDNESQ